MRTLSLLMLGMIVACCKVQPPAEEPQIVIVEPSDAGLDESHLSKCAVACNHMRLLKCPEGSSANCETVCESAPSSRITSFDVDCADLAMDVFHMRMCGVRCSK